MNCPRNAIGSFSADHERLVVGAEDTIRVFSEEGQLQTMTTGSSKVGDLAFQGPSLVRATDVTGTLHLWPACRTRTGCRENPPEIRERLESAENGWVALDAAGHFRRPPFREALEELTVAASEKVPANLFLRDRYVPGLLAKLVGQALASRNLWGFLLRAILHQWISESQSWR